MLNLSVIDLRDVIFQLPRLKKWPGCGDARIGINNDEHSKLFGRVVMFWGSLDGFCCTYTPNGRDLSVPYKEADSFVNREKIIEIVLE